MSTPFRDFPRSHGALHVGRVTFNADDDAQRQSEKMARVILDRMFHFAGLLDRDGTILEINLPALEGAGVPIEDIRGTPFWEARWFALSLESKSIQRQFVERAAAGEFIRCDLEVYGEASGEQTIIADYSLTPVRDNSGEVVFLLAEGRNITRKKEVEQEVVRKNAELEQLLLQVKDLDAQKNRFFSNLSHELRTPLTLILGPVDEMLANPQAFSARQLTELGSVRRNAVALLRLVNELLDLAKLDSGKMQLNYQRVDIVALARDVVSHFEAHALQRHITCIVQAEGPLDVDVDAEKLTQVIFNLVANAFHATPQGGRITCTLDCPDHLRWLLSVRDKGPGISTDQRERIFERFQQGEAGSATPSIGTGLGLAIVKEFVELHQGSVSVGEAPGGGALFQAQLPLRAPFNVQVRPKAAPTPPLWMLDSTVELPSTAPTQTLPIIKSDRPKVLVVEDSDEMRHLICRVLDAEFDVASAANGYEALAQLRKSPPELVITDLMMPAMNGSELVRQMRHEPDLMQIPVLVLSARADEELRQRLLSEWVQDYVTKPFFVPELLSRVRNLVMMRMARAALQSELETHNADLFQLTRELISGRTALRQSLEDQQKSERRWRAIHENSAVGIAVVGSQCSLVTTNPAFCRMLGYTAQELDGANLLDLTHPDDRDITSDRLSQLLAGELKEYHFQKRFIHKGGQSLWTRSSVSVIPETRDSPPLMIGIVEDIDERKRAEQALHQTQAELARVMRFTAMGELVASITHEIKQPLAAITANGHACRRWLTNEPAEINEALSTSALIVRDAQRAVDVVQRIRGFLKRGDQEFEKVDLTTLVGSVIDYVRDTLHHTEMDLQTHFTAPQLMVSGDRIQLQQVVLNLLLNAIEAMQFVANPRRLAVATGISDHEGSAYVRVEDTGVGINEQDVERIFDAFYTTKPDGLGMGLAICRTIIEAHGGELRVIFGNRSHTGSLFQITLPIASGDQG